VQAYLRAKQAAGFSDVQLSELAAQLPVVLLDVLKDRLVKKESRPAGRRAFCGGLEPVEP
jgi:hypothetical protein